MRILIEILLFAKHPFYLNIKIRCETYSRVLFVLVDQEQRQSQFCFDKNSESCYILSSYFKILLVTVFTSAQPLSGTRNNFTIVLIPPDVGRMMGASIYVPSLLACLDTELLYCPHAVFQMFVLGWGQWVCDRLSLSHLPKNIIKTLFPSLLS